MSTVSESIKSIEDLTFQQLQAEAEDLRSRLNRFRESLGRFFVHKQDLIDLMVVAAVAQVQPVTHPHLFPRAARHTVEQDQPPAAGRIGQGAALDQPAALEVEIESKSVHQR